MAVVRKNQNYNGLKGLSADTAANLGAYQSGYQKGAQVQAAEDELAKYSGAWTPNADTQAAKNNMDKYSGEWTPNAETQKTKGMMDIYSGEWTPNEDTQAAKDKLAQYQEGYTPSDTVTAAMNRLQELQNSKPAAYSSKYSQALDSILQRIQNPEEFKYEFNGDELFKSYADMYGRQANLGMMNAMGNAAALTGGYGNSYAQQVGQQAYDERMNDLYGIGLDLYDRAYQRYGDQRADLYNQYGAISAQDQIDYGRYRDTVGDWKDELGYWTDYANNERDFDYGQYSDMLDYWTNTYNTERDVDYGQYMDNRDYWTNRYTDQRDTDYNQYTDYRDYWTNRYTDQRDTDYNQYMGERDYWENRANTLYGQDYGEYSDMLNYWNDVADAENADYWNQANMDMEWQQFMLNLDESRRQFDISTEEGRKEWQAKLAENARQFDASLDWDKMSTAQSNAMQLCLRMLENGQIPSAELLAQAGITAADAQKLIPQAGTVSGGGSGGGTGATGGTGGTGGTGDDGMSFYEGNLYVLQNSPLDTPLSSLNPSNTSGTLADLGKKVQDNAAKKEEKKNANVAGTLTKGNMTELTGALNNKGITPTGTTPAKTTPTGTTPAKTTPTGTTPAKKTTTPKKDEDLKKKKKNTITY